MNNLYRPEFRLVCRKVKATCFRELRDVKAPGGSPSMDPRRNGSGHRACYAQDTAPDPPERAA